jgi:hypothetical protein
MLKEALATAMESPAVDAAEVALASGVKLKDFEQFFLYMAYDAMGKVGSFRRHMCHRKDTGDLWALEMNAGLTKVRAAVKSLQTKVSTLPKPRNADIQLLCREVMTSAQPPIKMYAGYTRCYLSKQHCNMCVDLTRPSKNATHVHVHARYSHFFLMLWFTNKIEYIVRSCARAWYDSMQEDGTQSISDMCKQFAASTTELRTNLFSIFQRGYQHVDRSLDEIFRASVEAPSLTLAAHD